MHKLTRTHRHTDTHTHTHTHRRLTYKNYAPAQYFTVPCANVVAPAYEQSGPALHRIGRYNKARAHERADAVETSKLWVSIYQSIDTFRALLATLLPKEPMKTHRHTQGATTVTRWRGSGHR